MLSRQLDVYRCVAEGKTMGWAQEVWSHCMQTVMKLGELTQRGEERERRWPRAGLLGTSNLHGWAGKVELAKEREAVVRRLGKNRECVASAFPVVPRHSDGAWAEARALICVAL